MGSEYGSSLIPLLRLGLGNLVIMVLGAPFGSPFGGSTIMILVAPVGYPLGGSIGKFLGLELRNSFGTWERSLVVVKPITLDGLITGTWEVSLVGSSLGLLLGLPLGMDLVKPLGLLP